VNVLTIPRTVIGAEYAALRLPLTVLETKVVGRYLEEESTFRLTFEKALGTVDATVGRALGDADLTRRGAALTRRSEILEKAVSLEEKAAVRKKAAGASLKQAKQTAERKRADAQQRAQAEVKQIHDDQQAERRAAEEQAQAVAQARVEAADREAEVKLQQEQSTFDEQLTSIDSRTAARVAKPKAELKEASQLRTDAARERKTAERLGELVDTEKASRR
jgi:hypothetical protein